MFEFTPFIPGKSFFLFYDLVIEACCEGKCASAYWKTTQIKILMMFESFV